jgi:4-amino-4-deoxy-L-arabinose transferase-like glycosyltransferase
VSVGTVTRPLRQRLTGAGRLHAVSSPAAVTVGALTLLAAILRFAGLGHQGFWFDEGNTALLVHFSPGKMLGLIPQSESTPPLYYCIAWVWARMFGYGEAGLRSLSALAGVATVPVAYGAARKLVSERAGVIAAALTACNPFLIWYSQEARSYSLLVLLTALSLLAFAHARANPARRALIAWVLFSALSLATHYYALLAIVPQAVILLLAHWRRRPVQVAVGAVGVCGLALIPLALSQNSTGNAGWIAKIALGPRLGQIIPHFLIGTGAPAYDVLEPLAAAMVLGSLTLLALRSERAERTRALTAAALAVGGLLLSLVLVAVGVDDLITRNVIALWIPAAILVAAGFAAGRAGVMGVLAAIVLCGTGVAAAVGVAADQNLQRPDWRAVAHVLGPGPIGARVILVQHYRDLLPLSLYVPDLSFWRQRGSQTVRELDVVSISAPREKLCWWGSACNLSGSPMQGSYPLPGFRELWLRHAHQFTIMRLVSAKPLALTHAQVAHALTATTLRRDELLIQR